MPSQIFPSQLHNGYRGHRLALWLFAAILLLKTGIALVFNGHAAAQTADGIPLDTFGAAGAQAIVTLFAMWGLAQLVISFFGVLALIRYRAMILLMYVVVLSEPIARRAILLWKLIARAGGNGSIYTNLMILPALMIAGLVLTIWKRKSTSALPGSSGSDQHGRAI